MLGRIKKMPTEKHTGMCKNKIYLAKVKQRKSCALRVGNNAGDNEQLFATYLDKP